ncbi:MAG TPA: YgjV family protein [Gemmatimonadales bacterium]|jgi:uncharacterized transporter YbjL
MRVTDWIGWAATAVFLASYGCKDQRKLRLTQAGAALLWVVYGTILHALPIMIANLLVAAVAGYSCLSGSIARRRALATAPAVSISAGEPDLSRTS